MARRKKAHKLTRPTRAALARDRRSKQALERAYPGIRRQLDQAIRKHRDLQTLRVPLKKLDKLVYTAAYGPIFFGRKFRLP